MAVDDFLLFISFQPQSYGNHAYRYMLLVEVGDKSRCDFFFFLKQVTGAIKKRQT